MTASAFAHASSDRNIWHHEITQSKRNEFARPEPPTCLPRLPAPDDAGASTRRQVTPQLSVPRLSASRPAEVTRACRHDERAEPTRIGNPTGTRDEAPYRIPRSRCEPR